MDVPENVEPWKGSEDRLQKIGAAFPALCTSAVVKDGERRAVRDEDVQTIWNLCPMPLAVFRPRQPNAPPYSGVTGDPQILMPSISTPESMRRVALVITPRSLGSSSR